jgi:hypothetical protein
MRAGSAELRGDRLKFALECRDALAKLGAVELDEGACRLVGEFCQHGALIVVEVIAGRVRAIKRNRQTAEAVGHRDRQDRAHQPIGQAIALSGLGIDPEGAARLHWFQHRVARIECSRLGVIPALILSAAEEPALFAKYAGGSEAEGVTHPLDKMVFDFRKIRRVQDRVAKTLSGPDDGAIEKPIHEIDGDFMNA